MKLPFWIVPREQKKNRKTIRNEMLRIEPLEMRLVPTTNLPDLVAITGAPTSSEIGAFDVNGIDNVDDGSGPSNTPVISEWTHAAAPGESIVVTGLNFDQNTVFWLYGQTGPTETDPLRAVVQNINTDTHQAQITLPSSLNEGSMYVLWAQNGGQASDPVTINQTEAWWVSRDPASPNRIFTVHGQNLTAVAGDWTTQSVGSAPSVVYYRNGSTGAFTQGTIVAANPYSVTFRSNTDLKAGNYEVWVSNKLGGDFGWSKVNLEITDNPVTATSLVNIEVVNDTDPNKLWRVVGGDSDSVKKNKGDHNAELLKNLFLTYNTNSTNTILKIDFNGEIPISKTIDFAAQWAGRNITLQGQIDSNGAPTTTFTWFGIDGGYMFYNNYFISNYTIKDFIINNGSEKVVADGIEKWAGGAIPFNLTSQLSEVRFDNLVINAQSTAAIKVQTYQTTDIVRFNGLYITNSTISTSGMSIGNGDNLVIQHSYFRETNDAQFAMILVDVMNATVTDNTAESYFAQEFRDANTGNDPDTDAVDDLRDHNSGADWGRRFFWQAYAGGNVYLANNVTRYLGIRVTGSTSGAYDLGYNKTGYDQNTGEQYAWDGGDIGFQAIPASTSGTSLTFPSSAVSDLSNALSFLKYLKYDNGYFSAMVVTGAGEGQIRRITGYSSASGTDTFTLDSAFDIPLETTGNNASVVMIIPVFNNVVLYKNQITGLPGNREQISAVEGDIGILVYQNTYNFVVDTNQIQDIRWGLVTDAIAGSNEGKKFNIASISANNRYINNKIDNTRKAIVVEVQTSNIGSDRPTGQRVAAYGNIFRDNELTNVNEAGITFMYNRSKNEWQSSLIIVANIFESNDIELGIVSGDTVSSPATGVGINLDFGYFPATISTINFAPIRGLLLRSNTVVNTLTTTEMNPVIGLVTDFGTIPGGKLIPQQVVLADNEFSGFASTYGNGGTSDSEKLAPWDGEVIVASLASAGHYKLIFRRKDESNIPSEGYLYEVDSNNDGTFDAMSTSDPTDSLVTFENQALADNARLRVTNLKSGSSVIYSLSNSSSVKQVFYFGSSKGDLVSFSNSSGTVSVDWDDLGGTNPDSFSGIDGPLVVNAGDGADTINASGMGSIHALISGGGDADSITGADNDDTLIGGGGNDTLIGGAGNDSYVYSGNVLLGEDRIVETTVSGGSGDTLDFSNLGIGVNVDLSTLSSGAQEINDLLSISVTNDHTVENVIGSSHADTITGDGNANQITGGEGNDTLEGGTANDTLAGGEGDDTYVFADSSLGTDSINEASNDGSDTLDFSSFTEGSGLSNLDLSSTSSQALTSAGTPSRVILQNTTSIENVIGTSSADTITGNSRANRLDGGSGNDTMAGADGNDTLIGAYGNDSLTGGNDDDTYVFSGSGDLGTDSINEAANVASDTLDFSKLSGIGASDTGVNIDISSSGSSTPLSGRIALSLSSSSGIENVIGTAGKDSITGNGRANIFEGGGGNDTLIGSTGNDTYVFRGSTDLGVDTITDDTVSGGSDTLDFAKLDAAVNVDLGSIGAINSLITLSLTNAGTIENVVGTDFADTITGDSNGNQLLGGEGNDTLEGGTANDTLEGGKGDDTYVFADSGLGTDSINEASNDGSDTLDFSGFTEGSGLTDLDLSSTSSQALTSAGTPSRVVLQNATSIENVIGTDNADTITGNSRDNRITGGGGNDTMKGGSGDDTYLFAGQSDFGSDVIDESTGGGGSDTIDFSGLGYGATNYSAKQVTIDLSITHASSFQVVSGSGSQIRLNSGTTIENVFGTDAADSITGNSSDNLLIGGKGNDAIIGSDGNDTLIGDAGNDTFNGGIGDDLYFDSSGNDTYTYGNDSTNLGADVINETDTYYDSDTIDFSGFTAGITIDLSKSIQQTIYGSTKITLGKFASIAQILGSSYADSITGNSLANSITGGGGNDTLAGGEGDDTYIFGNSSSQSDTIDESVTGGNDTISFASISGLNVNFNLGTTGLQTAVGSLQINLLDDTIENIIGGSGNDTLTGNSADNIITGGAGNDSLVGEAGNDTYIFSGSALGNDTISEADNADSDTLDFGAYSGPIFINLSDGTQQTVQGSTKLTLLSGLAIENVIGGTGNDTLLGNSEDNIITGGGGDDSLTGSTGNDTYVFGGSADLGTDTVTEDTLSGGNDTFDFSNRTDAVSVDLGSIGTINSKITLVLTNAGTIENVVGTSSADTITGTSGDNRLEGGGGNDSITGGAGNDTYVYSGTSNLGTDSINDSAGTDSFDFSKMGFAVTVDLSLTSIEFKKSNFIQISANSIENVTGSSFDDTLAGSSGDNVLAGGDGNDTYLFNSTSSQSDTIDESASGGNDTISFESLSADVSFNLGTTSWPITAVGSLQISLTHNNSIENLIGGSGNDALTGNSADNILRGGGGNDTLAGGSGNDTYAYTGTSAFGEDTIDESTGSGTDTLDFSRLGYVNTDFSGLGININLASSSLQNVRASGTNKITLVTGTSIENVIGSDGDDTITGSTSANALYGNSGNDVISGGDGNDSIWGGHGNDTVNGEAGEDFVAGDFVLAVGDTFTFYGFGNDSVSGGSGNDEIIGGAGNDDIDGGTGNDIIVGDEGVGSVSDNFASSVNDNIDGLFGDDTIDGGDGEDSIIGGGGADLIQGQSGDDFVVGDGGTIDSGIIYRSPLTGTGLGRGDDTIFGGDGDDWIVGGEGNDVMVGDDGGLDSLGVLIDSLFAGTGNDVVMGDEGNDLIYGVGGADTLVGDTTIFDSETGEYTFVGSGSDIISGGDGDDIVAGGDGNDTISGGDGADVLFGGFYEINSVGGLRTTSNETAGDDLILGDAGNDTVFGSTGDDILFGGTDNDVMVGDDGGLDSLGVLIDSLFAGTGNDIVMGDEGNDTIYGVGGSDVLIGDTTIFEFETGEYTFVGSGSDIISGGDGNDTIGGGDGNDTISGGDGADILFGGFYEINSVGGELRLTSNETTGDDLILGDAGNDTVFGSTGDDILFGGTDNDVMVGDDGGLDSLGVLIDSLFAGTGNDIVMGDEGNDTIYGVGGADTLIGDTTIFEFETGEYTFVGSGSDIISGGDGDDIVGGGDGNDTISGGDGADILFGGFYEINSVGGLRTTSNETAGDDLILGDAGNDTVFGSTGDDILFGGTDNDVMVGDDGGLDSLGVLIDSLFAGTGNDIVMGDEGNDTIYGVGGADTLIGDTTIFEFETGEYTFVGSGSDIISGGDGDDIVGGGDGNDTISGGDGADILFGGFYEINSVGGLRTTSNETTGDDLILGDAGNDTVFGSTGDDILFGGTDNDVMVGDDGGLDSLGVLIDSLFAGTGNDSISGSEDDDVIFGSGGDDIIFGDVAVWSGGLVTAQSGTGNDILVGGDGNDQLVGQLGNDLIDGGDGEDYIAGDQTSLIAIIDDPTPYDGNDTITAGVGADTVYGSGGNDLIFGDQATIVGSSSSSTGSTGSGDYIEGGDGNDSIVGGFGNDAIKGNDGNDVIMGDGGGFISGTAYPSDSSGGNGDDSIIGGNGNDTIYGQDGNDVILGDVGDIVSGAPIADSGSGADTIFGGNGNDTIDGQGGDDGLLGESGNDILNGADGNDLIGGGDGADFLIGGAGADSLYGDDGEDILVSGSIDVSASAFGNFVTSIQAEWLNTASHSYAARINYIKGVSLGGANGTDYLTATTINNDAAVDLVMGEFGTPDNANDWFLMDLSNTPLDLNDTVSGEAADDIDGF